MVVVVVVVEWICSSSLWMSLSSCDQVAQGQGWSLTTWQRRELLQLRRSHCPRPGEAELANSAGTIAIERDSYRSVRRMVWNNLKFVTQVELHSQIQSDFDQHCGGKVAQDVERKQTAVSGERAICIQKSTDKSGTSTALNWWCCPNTTTEV